MHTDHQTCSVADSTQGLCIASIETGFQDIILILSFHYQISDLMFGFIWNE